MSDVQIALKFRSWAIIKGSYLTRHDLLPFSVHHCYVFSFQKKKIIAMCWCASVVTEMKVP